MKPRAVVAAAGRRIDPDDVAVTRFPPAAVLETRQRIDDVLVQCGAAVVVSSGACGADLLALSAAADLRVRSRMVLPCDPEQFRETSVADRPGNWGALFDEIVAQLQPAGEVLILNESPDDTGYAVVGETILAEAERIAGDNRDALVAMIIWDGRHRPGVDFTAQFRESAGRRGFKIVDVQTLHTEG